MYSIFKRPGEKAHFYRYKNKKAVECVATIFSKYATAQMLCYNKR